MTTADDAAGVTPETARVMQDLEDVRSHVVTFALPEHVAAIDAAIDRLIVLDNATHPRDRALKQDARRGNFRNNDAQEDGA